MSAAALLKLSLVDDHGPAAGSRSSGSESGKGGLLNVGTSRPVSCVASFMSVSCVSHLLSCVYYHPCINVAQHAHVEHVANEHHTLDCPHPRDLTFPFALSLLRPTVRWRNGFTMYVGVT